MTQIGAVELDGEESMHVRIQDLRLWDPSLNGCGEWEGRVGGQLPFAAVNFELMYFLPWEFSFERIILFPHFRKDQSDN